MQTGMYGYPMCTAAEQAEFLLKKFDERHKLVLAESIVLPQVIMFNLLMAQLFITGLTGVGAYFLLSALYGDSLNSLAAPLISILIISFATVGIFTNLLVVVIATITQDYAKGIELHILYILRKRFLMIPYFLSEELTYSGSNTSAHKIPKLVQEFRDFVICMAKSLSEKKEENNAKEPLMSEPSMSEPSTEEA